MRSAALRSASTLALAALIMVMAATAPSVGGAATSEPPGRDPAMELVALDPWVGADTTVTARVALHAMPTGSTITPVLHGAVVTRSAFELTTEGSNLAAPVAELATKQTSGPSSTINVRFSVTDGSGEQGDNDDGDRVTLSEAGVYPLVFTARDADGVELARMVTYIVRLPTAPTEGTSGRHPLAVASQFRLQPRPTADVDGTLTVPAAARDDAEALIAGLTSGTDADKSRNDNGNRAGEAGRNAASEAVRRSLGFAISPAFLDASGRHGDPGIVDDLAEATDGTLLQSQPWAPIALADWLATPRLTAEVDRTTDRGDTVLDTRLHEPDPTLVDLPAWGADISAEALRWFTDRGASAFLVASEDLDALDPVAFPRTLAAPFLLATGADEPVPAMQLDAGIAAHFTEPDPILGANQLIADLSIIALALPSISRAMVVAPPPEWTPSSDMLSAYLDALGAKPPEGSESLLTAAPLDDIIDDTPVARLGGDITAEGPPLVRSLAEGAAGTPLPGLGRQVTDTGGLVDSLATMEPGGTARSAVTTRSLREQIALAAMPGEPEVRRTKRFGSVRDQVTTTASSLRLPERQTITLTSNTATLPLTIRREADGPTRVSLHVDAPDRLSFPEGKIRSVELEDTVTRVNLRVHSDSPGDTIVRLRVTSPDNKLVADTGELVVRSTAASGVGLVITFGSLTFLIIWWGLDIFRTRRRRRERRIPPAELIDIG